MGIASRLPARRPSPRFQGLRGVWDAPAPHPPTPPCPVIVLGSLVIYQESARELLGITRDYWGIREFEFEGPGGPR